MVLRKFLPKALIVCSLVVLFTINAFAQTRSRQTTQYPDVNDISCAPDDFSAAVATPEAVPVWEAKPKPTIDVAPSVGLNGIGMFRLQPMLLAAIDERLGSRYKWGATGPTRFDCSGFVWSIFQSVGITFERGSARTLYARFAPPTADEQYKFGTLVFFNGLSHVGVVADENGFYHASRRHGVVYAPFEGYWGKHIDGFRRVPMPVNISAD